MVRFLTDENLDNRILRGLLRRLPELDVARVQDVGLSETDDRAILAWAAKENRVLLTHDAATMTAFAYERISYGLEMAGIFEIPKTLSIGEAVCS
jgi:predicted nuclease of predicted toxin-antitoxin system